MKEDVGKTQDKLKKLLPVSVDEQFLDFPIEFADSADLTDLYNKSQKIMKTMVEYKELMMRYSCAIKKIRTKFEIFDEEFNVQNQRNPIHQIKTRLKSARSILSKMKRNGIELSVENLEANINDVAGIRVTCVYVDDIYLISNALINQPDVRLIERKDYIAVPKPNGYRSMHLIVSIPVFFAGYIKDIKAEVQIRTIAMDFWATLEHQLKYKNLSNAGEEIAAELKECANEISKVDLQMLEIRKKIEANTKQPTEEEILLEKMKNFL